MLCMWVHMPRAHINRRSKGQEYVRTYVLMGMHAAALATIPAPYAAPYAAPSTPAPAGVDSAAGADTPTEADALCASQGPTWPPLSSNRAEGIRWAERLFAQARCASQDTARFARAAGVAL